MSDETKNTPPPAIDLSDFKLVPAWVATFGQEEPRPKYAEERPDDRRGGGRGFGNDRGGFSRSGGGGAGGPPRGRSSFGGPGGGGGGPGGAGGPRPQGDRPNRGAGDRGGERRGGGSYAGGGGRRDDRRGPPIDDRPALPSGVKAVIEAEDKALDALALHIKTQGRAFSLFDAARLVLAGEDRHHVKFDCEAERLVGLFSIPGSGLFETREEAFKFLLRSADAMAPYYKMEEVELEAPKGNFTSVGVCGFSGEVLGPPSHHSFQTALKRLHNERFGNMSIEDYRRRVRVESTPELVEKWKEEQKKGVRWVYVKEELAEGQEPQAFSSRADLEAHFRRIHGDDAVVEVREAVLPGTIRREQLSPGLGRLFRRNLEEARKHLFELSQKIAHGLERRGMKLFKRRAGKMFVSRVKPRAVDPGVIFSERIKAIVEVVRREPGILASKLVEAVAPSPAAEAAKEGEPAESKQKQFTDDQVQVLRDLRWLSDEGYVIEYSDGPVFLGVQGDPPQHAAEGKAAKEGKEPAEEAAPEVTDHVPESSIAEIAPEIAGEAEAVAVEETTHTEAAPEPAEESVAAVAEHIPESGTAEVAPETVSEAEAAGVEETVHEAEVETPVVASETDTVLLEKATALHVDPAPVPEEVPVIPGEPADEETHTAVEAPAPEAAMPVEEAKAAAPEEPAAEHHEAPAPGAA